MKKITAVLCLFISVQSFAQRDTAYMPEKRDTAFAKTATSPKKDFASGDFNGDGRKERMWLIKPQLTDNDNNCVGKCDSYIKFSDPAIPMIKVADCVGGNPLNLGDLDGNGTDEIGILPGWFQGCWRSYLVYTYKSKKWLYPVEPIMTYVCNDDLGDNFIPIRKDPKKNGYVLIRYDMTTADGDIVKKIKSVPVN